MVRGLWWKSGILALETSEPGLAGKSASPRCWGLSREGGDNSFLPQWKGLCLLFLNENLRNMLGRCLEPSSSIFLPRRKNSGQPCSFISLSKNLIQRGKKNPQHPDFHSPPAMVSLFADGICTIFQHLWLVKGMPAVDNAELGQKFPARIWRRKFPGR